MRINHNYNNNNNWLDIRWGEKIYQRVITEKLVKGFNLIVKEIFLIYFPQITMFKEFPGPQSVFNIDRATRSTKKHPLSTLKKKKKKNSVAYDERFSL